MAKYCFIDCSKLGCRDACTRPGSRSHAHKDYDDREGAISTGRKDDFCAAVYGASPRSSLRTTSFRPDQTSVTAQTLTSTKPRGRPTSRIVFSVTSVGTFEDFLGHEIHSSASGGSCLRSPGSKR